MNQRPLYPEGLMAAANRCNIDAPRTHWAAARERKQFGLALFVRHSRQYVVRIVGGEGVPISANQRSW